MESRDAAAWVGMRHRLWPDASVEDLASTVAAYFSGGTPFLAVAFVAARETDAVGFIEISIRAYVPGAAVNPAPHVEGWYVEPAFQGRGIGRLLMKGAESWAVAHGHAQLGSDVLIENTGSADAHKRLGFREIERVCFFVKDLR